MPAINSKIRVPLLAPLKGISMGLFKLLFGNRRTPQIVILPKQRVKNKVRPVSIPLYQQRGWIKNDNEAYGYFKTSFGAWSGHIIRRGDKLNIYIIDPPVEKLKKHPKWLCFTKKSKKTYRLHLRKQPKDSDINSVILYVEKIIEESYNGGYHD
jgi:hypothetical protein